MNNKDYEELLEWRKWEKILLEHPTWSLQIEDNEKEVVEDLSDKRTK